MGNKGVGGAGSYKRLCAIVHLIKEWSGQTPPRLFVIFSSRDLFLPSWREKKEKTLRVHEPRGYTSKQARPSCCARDSLPLRPCACRCVFSRCSRGLAPPTPEARAAALPAAPPLSVGVRGLPLFPSLDRVAEVNMGDMRR